MEIQMTDYICDRCRSDYQTEENRDKPVFTIVGSVAGLIAGLLTGYTVVLAPIGLFAGLSADAARCQKCGSDKELYKVMLEKRGEWDGKVYIPAFSRLSPGQRQRPSYRYDELENRFEVVQEMDNLEAFEMEMPQPDWEVDFTYNVDSSDVAFESDVGDCGFGGSEFVGGSDNGNFGTSDTGGDSGTSGGF
jgi:hypothetical protein